MLKRLDATDFGSAEATPEHHVQGKTLCRSSHVERTLPADARWYIAHTHVRRELLVADALGRKGFTTYIPMVTTTIRPQNRLQIVSRPLCPGYLFVGLDPAHDPNHSFSEIRKTFGLQWIVTNNARYVQVPTRVVETVQKLEVAGEWDETIPKKAAGGAYRPGDVVSVVGVAGSDEAFIAEVLNAPGNQRINVILKHFGKRVNVPIGKVKRAE